MPTRPRSVALFIIAFAAVAISPTHAWSQDELCTHWTASAPGRMQLANFSQRSMWGVRTTYYTTGTPDSLSVTLEAANEPLETKPPATKIHAVTDTKGADMGNAMGAYKYWWINVTTLSGGSSPTIVGTSCFSSGVMGGGNANPGTVGPTVAPTIAPTMAPPPTPAPVQSEAVQAEPAQAEPEKTQPILLVSLPEAAAIETTEQTPMPAIGPLIPVTRVPATSIPDDAPPAATPKYSGETRGQADLALQGYYLGGSQSLSSTSGVSVHFSDFVPKLGLLTGSLESYGADGRFRLGDNFITLGGVVLGGRRWSFTGGDFHVIPNTLDVPFTNIITPELAARGFKAQTTSKNRTITLFWGQATLLEGPRVPFRISVGQQMMGATLQQKLGERLVIGTRVMRITTGRSAFDPDSHESSLFPINRQFAAANLVAVQALFSLTKHLKFYGEAGETFTGTGGSQPMSLTGGAVYDTSKFTVRANFVSQGAAYLPVVGQFAGDRQGNFGEIRYRPFKALEVFASASKYRNNIEDREDITTFHSTGYSAGASVILPWKFSASATMSQLNYESNQDDLMENSKNRQISLAIARPIGRHNLRITVRDLQLESSTQQHQRSEEFEDSFGWKRFNFGGAIRRQETITDSTRQTLFFRGSMQAHFRRVNAFAQMEFGSDLVNQSVFSTSSFSTTVVGLSMPVKHGWNLQFEAFRNRLNTAVNPESIFLLSNQNNGFTSGLAGTDLSGFEQWSVFFRLSHQLHWGGPLPAGSNLEQFVLDQLPVVGSIEGIVSEPTADGPRRVEGIPVMLDNSRTALSDSEGHFRILNVPEGPHQVKLSTAELPAEFNPGQNAANTIVVRPRSLSRIDFQVVRLGQIVGHVDAPPKSGDENDVETIVIRLEPGGRYTTPDFEGNFGFYNLPEGQYKVSIDTAMMPKFSVMDTKTDFAVEVKTSQETPKIHFGYKIQVPEKPVRRIMLDSDAPAPTSQSQNPGPAYPRR